MKKENNRFSRKDLRKVTVKNKYGMFAASLLGTVIAASMAGCSTPSVNSSGDNNSAIEERGADNSVSSTASTLVTENDQNASDSVSSANEATTAVVNNAKLPSEENVRKCLDRFIDWSGLRMMESVKSYSSLDDDIAVAVSIFYAGHDYSKFEYSEDNGCAIIPRDNVEEAMMELFGKKFDYSNYTGQQAKKIDDENFGLTLGDWGTVYPKYDVNIVDSGNGEFVIEADYYPWNDEENNKWDKYELKAKYYCVVDENNPNGFYIKDMSGEAIENK